MRSPQSAPLVGITVNQNYDRERLWLPFAYCRSVERAGGMPVLIPPLEGEARFLLPARLQALLLPGGGDIAPLFFGQEPRPGLGEADPRRDELELFLVREALQRDLPLLGICRGLQLINVAAGGTLKQDLAGGEYLQHWQQAPRQFPWHTVRVLGHTRLGDLLGEGFLAVNSFHHQAVERPAPGFRVSAVAADGVVEALESCRHRFVLAVQWHPEALDHPASHRLFQALVAAARELFQP
ncbi:MAG: gamma-glutamyl-gamma-aminobutyrate hydrolase family protein [Firmicutes bacterium]|nr:gamma-glutamyl-gamma-aminobutyrate hydrolase family protein [Bacillota bacterium]